MTSSGITKSDSKHEHSDQPAGRPLDEQPGQIPKPDSKQEHSDQPSGRLLEEQSSQTSASDSKKFLDKVLKFLKDYGVFGIVATMFCGLPTFIINIISIYILISAAPIDPHNVVYFILIVILSLGSLSGCILIAIYYLNPSHNHYLLNIGVLIVAIFASILIGFYLQDQISKRIEPCPPCLTPSPTETSTNTSTPTPTPSQTTLPPTEIQQTPSSTNTPSLPPLASPTPPIYAIVNCIDYQYWVFSATSVTAPRDPDNPDCLKLENWRIYAGARFLPDSPPGLGIIGPLSSGVTIGIKYNVNQAEKISLDVYLKSISYSSEDCTSRESCDINLVIGIGSPTEYDGAFVVFRALKGSSSVRVCLLDSIFSSCDSPVFSIHPGENIMPYRLIFTINGRQVFIQLGNNTQPYSFTLGVNQSATLWLGYNTISNGKIDAYITFPP